MYSGYDIWQLFSESDEFVSLRERFSRCCRISWNMLPLSDIANPSGFPRTPACHLMRTSEKGGELCTRFHQQLNPRPRGRKKSRGVGVTTCNCGVSFFYFPVMVDREVCGLVVSEGVVIDQPGNVWVKELSSRVGMGQDEVRDAFQAMRSMTGEELQDIAVFLREILNEYLARLTAEYRLEHYQRSMSTVQGVSQALSTLLDPDELLKQALTHITRVMEVQTASLMLVDESGKFLTIRAACGLPKEVVESTRVKVGDGIAGWVAKKGKPLLIKDIEHDTRFKKVKLTDYRTRSAISAPMVIKNQIIGVVNVTNPESGEAFNDDDLDLLTSLAAPLATAIENARLHYDTERRLQELKVLLRVGETMNSVLDLDSLFSTVLDLITDIMKVENCSVMLFDQAGDCLRIRAAKGLPKQIVKTACIKPGEGISGWVAENGQPLLIRDLDAEKRFGQQRSSLDYKTRSALSVPLMAKRSVMGVINVNNEVSGEIFTEDDLRLLVILANQIAVALERTAHFKRASEKVEQLSLVHELTKSIGSTLKLQQVFDRIMEAVMSIFQADRGSLMLRNEETGMLTVGASRGIPEEVAKDLVFEPGEGVAGAVALTGNPLLIENVNIDERYKKRESVQDMTLLSVPLVSRDKVVGVLNVERTLDEEKELWSFTAEDQEFLSTLSSAAAIAIENADLYRHLLNGYLGTVQSLAAAIEAKDAYTHGHSTRVTELSLSIAFELGLSEDDIDIIRHSALLHDIGKIGVSDNVLLKPGGLTNEEFSMIKQHPLLGTKILQSVEFLDSVRRILLAHHERYDGKGYPQGLKGNTIPLGGRIIAVADSFDAMVSDRPYRRGLSHQVAVEEINSCSGSQFDPQVVRAFLRMLANQETTDQNDKPSTANGATTASGATTGEE